jgi:glycine/D-amino acid oxidase-like deaminating enzyme
MSRQPHIIVAGAGIIGASIAYHLAKSGAAVTLIEASEPGGVATRTSWAWLNASWGNPQPYFALRRRSLAEWKRLAAEIPALRVHWVGGLLWDLPERDLKAYAAEHAGWGYGIRLVDSPEAQRIEPALRAAPDLAVHVAEEGALEPLASAQAILAAAQSHGATLKRARILKLLRKDGRVGALLTDQGEIAADHIVLATGAATATLAATADIHVPMSTPPGLLVQTAPTAKMLNGLVMAPEMHVRQLEDGSLLAGADFGGSDPGSDAAATAAAVFAGLQRLLQDGDGLRFARYQIGHRPLPADGFPIVGAAPGVEGLYLAVTHSGITLAPALGHFAAAELLGAARDPLLAPYHPARFA